MKIAWLTPYPAQGIGDAVEWHGFKKTFHSCGWIVNLQKALVALPGVELHLFVLQPRVERTQCVEKDGAFIHVIKSKKYIHCWFLNLFTNTVGCAASAHIGPINCFN
jgi:hypothetical protein